MSKHEGSGLASLKSVATAVAAAAFLYASTGLASETVSNWPHACKVVGVSDGDTVNCLTENKELLRIRLARIDAPESRQDFGARAKQKLSDKIFGKMVDLNILSEDLYGRQVAVIMLGKRDINKEMVEDGFAWVYRAFSSDPEYIAAENRARAADRGLWVGHKPIPPWEWRRGNRPGPANATRQGTAIYQSMGR